MFYFNLRFDFKESPRHGNDGHDMAIHFLVAGLFDSPQRGKEGHGVIVADVLNPNYPGFAPYLKELGD